jgi:hypothetical protein
MIKMFKGQRDPTKWTCGEKPEGFAEDSGLLKAMF